MIEKKSNKLGVKFNFELNLNVYYTRINNDLPKCWKFQNK